MDEQKSGLRNREKVETSRFSILETRLPRDRYLCLFGSCQSTLERPPR